MIWNIGIKSEFINCHEFFGIIVYEFFFAKYSFSSQLYLNFIEKGTFCFFISFWEMYLKSDLIFIKVLLLPDSTLKVFSLHYFM